MQFKIKLVQAEAMLPTRADPGSSGWDLRSAVSTTILPGARKLISTGLSMEVPMGFEVQIRPRSGLALKSGITVLNTPGTIDSSFRGVVGVVLFNTSDSVFEVNCGDRIAQAVVVQLPMVELVEVAELSDTERGTGGFGSTGVK